MTDPDANPDKPVPHGGGTRRPKQPVEPDRTYLDPEQHVPADEVERFTEKYGAWKPR